MAQDPDRPLDDGMVSMPRVDAGHNRVGPTARPGGKGGQKDKEALRTGEQREKRKRDDQAILSRARKRFERVSRWESDNRKAGVDDDKFYAGDQWPSDIVAERNFAKRPVLTINKLPTFVHQITNDQRQNRPTINISPVGDGSDVNSASIFRGLIREIERDSFADLAYDTAFESAARKGWGYWRIVTEYESPRSMKQVIRIKRVRNAFSVYLDPDRQEPDGADAKWAFVTDMIPRDEFKAKYPRANQMAWPFKAIGDQGSMWVDEHHVRIAEYFEYETERRTLVELSNGHVGLEDELDDEVWEAIGSNRLEIIDERETDIDTLHWYFITAVDILKEEPWAGRYIPIVEVVGEELDIEGKVKKWGIVRQAKDAQRQYNYWTTSETEQVALAPKAKVVMAGGQDEGYENEWKTANTASNPILHYNQMDLNGQPAPPPIFVQPQQASTALLQAKQAAAQDFQAVTGIRFDGTLQERVYDESGKALRELSRHADIGQYHLIDNLSRSLRHTGNILVDLVPKIKDTKQIATILREDDTEEIIQIDPNAAPNMRETRNPMTQKMMKIFNPTVGQYGVTVTIGPSFATKRIEASEDMMEFGVKFPQAGPLIMDLVAKYSDWPGSEEIATRLASALPPGLLKPDMRDVPPQVQALLGQLQQQLAQLQQEKAALMQQVMEKDKDRAVKMDAQEKDFEAKLLDIVMQMETKMAAVEQKADSSVITHIGSQLKDLAEGVKRLEQTLGKPNGTMQ